jgi:hypothetical protein
MESEMRGKSRIKPFLKTLGDLWVLYPDMRFTQFVAWLSVVGEVDFYSEDEDTMAVIARLICMTENGDGE